jgi:hypothetical protein
MCRVLTAPDSAIPQAHDEIVVEQKHEAALSAVSASSTRRAFLHPQQKDLRSPLLPELQMDRFAHK